METEDLRVVAVRPLVPAAILHEEVPLTKAASNLVQKSRRTIEACLRGEDRRLVVVVGPCSIHDVEASLDFAGQLKKIAGRHESSLLVVMRCYFEKPRTTVGWKGLLNDPFLDGSFRVNDGLRMARRLLADVTEIGLPTACEWLDTTTPQHLADFVSWGAIGARTVESQTHRELASGLSMPIGFKNSTEGSVRVAADAIRTARHPHRFTGATKDGLAAIVETTGNPSCHLVLRGGSRSGPNYHREQVLAASALLGAEGLPPRLMVDCSHGNSRKDYRMQVEVAADLGTQLLTGDSPVFGVMLEGFLVDGRQEPDSKSLAYGQSITDACLSIGQVEEILENLAMCVGASRLDSARA